MTTSGTEATPGAAKRSGGDRRELGRPRHYDPDTERTMLLKATRRLLRKHPYPDVTLSAILAESGLHTRAFYRHFDTKDDILATIYRDEARVLQGILAAKVDTASSPALGVMAWIDEMLRLQFDPHTVPHVSFYQEAAAGEAMQRLGASQDSERILIEPLVRALRAGRGDGSFPEAVPEVHAAFIYTLLWNGANAVPGRNLQERWANAREMLVGFVMDGLGWNRPLTPK